MELWIRSQDRQILICCKDITIKTNSDDGKTIRGYNIVGYFDKETEYETLGFYVKKERALEVLDDIQKLIFFEFELRGKYEELDLKIKSYILTSMCKIYTMPKE